MRFIQIIGGNSDIGFNVAKCFAKDNFNVQLVSQNFNELKNKQIELEKNYKVKCIINELDFQNFDQVNNFIKTDKIQPEIILVAIGYLEKFEKNYEKIINLNYRTLVNYLEQNLLNGYKKEKLNTIIGISSVAGEKGKKMNNIYSSSKAAFSVYLDGLRQRLYKDKINVILIKPGYVKTKMTKDLNLPKILTSSPNKIAKIIFDSYKYKKTSIYAPFYWKYLLFIYKMIPEFIFKLIDKSR